MADEDETTPERRLIVHVRWCPPFDPDESSEERALLWSELVGVVLERTRAFRGRVIGWSVESLVIDFSWAALTEAVDFMVDAPFAPELACGFCDGIVETRWEAPRIALGLGRGLRLAQELAELARPGEILVDPELVRRSEGRLESAGDAGRRAGRPEISALILNPLRPVDENRIFENAALSSLPSSSPPEARSTTPSARESELRRFGVAAGALGSPSTFPELAQQALARRDARALLDLAASIRVESDGALADRLEALAELAEGKSGAAIRRFRLAKVHAVASDPSEQCRAAVALGVALAAAGRPYDAALETLEGLARARAGQDLRGQRACAGLLSQIAVALGDEGSALAWSEFSRSSG